MARNLNQIIIDGVDVSGCEWYSSTYFKPCDGCKNTPNCCYKQLKRKEQELQEAMDNYVKLDNQRVKEYNELVSMYKAKEQECEELKQRLHQCWTVENSFVEQLDQLESVNKKLKQALTELKDFVENEMIPNDDTHIILQLISEVEHD